MTKKKFDELRADMSPDRRDQADERALEQLEIMDLQESLASIGQSEQEYAQGKGFDALQVI